MMNIAAQQRPVLCAPSLSNVKYYELPKDHLLYSVLHITKVTHTGLYAISLKIWMDELFRLLCGIVWYAPDTK